MALQEPQGGEAERPWIFAEPGCFELYYHHSLPTVYPREMHDTIQVCIPLDDARYDVRRESETAAPIVQHLGARDVLVVPAGQPHAVSWLRPADIVMLHLDGNLAAQALGADALALGDALALRDPFLSEAAAQIRHTYVTEGTITPAYAQAMATIVAHRIGRESHDRRHLPDRARALRTAQLMRIERFVDENLDRPILIGDLARLLHVSKWHFLRSFKARTGRSPHRFITERRLSRARSLLIGTELPITTIALEVGMTHSHFSRTFFWPASARRPTNSVSGIAASAAMRATFA
jgi:AraC family transcriptional regulator